MDNLLHQAQWEPLKATRRRPGRKSYTEPTEQTRFLRLTGELADLLRSGDWKRKGDVLRLCKRYKVDFPLFAETLRLAESDSGNFIAWPNESTPQQAPDEN
jgi:hypothetical protein